MNHMKGFPAKRHMSHRKNTKARKLDSALIMKKTVPPEEYSHLSLMTKSVKSVCLVFDGGASNTPPLEEIKLEAGEIIWKSIQISSGELWVADTTDARKGITYPSSSGDAPFTRIPRKAALEMTGLLDYMDDSNCPIT